MLVPIRQLRLHVIISKVIADQGKHRGARDVFSLARGHPGVGQVVNRGIGFPKRASLRLLSHHLTFSDSTRGLLTTNV